MLLCSFSFYTDECLRVG
uniref:Uncharacterized protein n=1 Tax=Zea mays TaxID=4577 RepID=C4J7L1_MAIZE|nr:unknown [Zea mays]